MKSLEEIVNDTASEGACVTCYHCIKPIITAVLGEIVPEEYDFCNCFKEIKSNWSKLKSLDKEDKK